MNTGAQRSGTTPIGAITANTIHGKPQVKKDVPAIMAAHNLPYVATCSASYPIDLYDKLVKAKGIKGTKYIHIHIPCPPGWGFDPKDTVKIGRLAVETGLFDLYEIENTQFKLTAASQKMLEKRKLVPVKEYFKAQSRFATMPDDLIEKIQQQTNAKWEEYFKAED